MSDLCFLRKPRLSALNLCRKIWKFPCPVTVTPQKHNKYQNYVKYRLDGYFEIKDKFSQITLQVLLRGARHHFVKTIGQISQNQNFLDLGLFKNLSENAVQTSTVKLLITKLLICPVMWNSCVQT